jgi:hypothetical protein
MPAPVASGWSGCRVGLAPTGKRRLARRTGHATTDTDIRFRLGFDECYVLYKRLTSEWRATQNKTANSYVIEIAV